MIKQLSIKNFKGIRQGRLEGLTEVNIFIGRNNSGKSTILEALYFVKAAFEPVDILHNPVLQHILSRRISRQLSDSEEFFHKYDPDNRILVGLTFEGDKTVSIESTLQQNTPTYMLVDLKRSDGKKCPSISVSPRNKEVSLRDFWWQRGNSAEPTKRAYDHIIRKLEAMKSEKVKLELENVRKRALQYFRSRKEEFHFLSQITLLDADIVRKIEEIETKFWRGFRRSRMDKELVNMLNEIFKTKIDNLALIPSFRKGDANIEEGPERKTLHRLSAAIQDFSLDIDGFGEGLRDALSILLLASQLRNTALLIEEPEAHQHPEALTGIFRYLLDIAKRNDLQLFITTHSLDVLSALTSFSDSHKMTIFHTDLDASGKLNTRMIDGVDARLLTNLGTDLRFLSELFCYLVIEGREDRVFLNAIAERLYNKSLDKFPFEILEISKNQQKEHLKTLASTGREIKVVQDYDEKSKIDEIVKSFASSLESKYGCSVETEHNHIDVKETGSHITVLAAGLPQDSDLKFIGIRCYAMEDYLLKLLSIDENLEKWAGMPMKELRNRADKLRNMGSLSKSKTLLAALAVIKNMSEETLIEEMIKNSDPRNIRKLLKSLVEEIFQKVDNPKK